MSEKVFLKPGSPDLDLASTCMSVSRGPDSKRGQKAADTTMIARLYPGKEKQRDSVGQIRTCWSGERPVHTRCIVNPPQVS